MNGAEIISCHLRTADREAALRGLRAVAGCGAPIAVWPPRPLPPGILVSPERYGWISLCGLPEPCDQLVPSLTATLECAGVIFHVIEEEYWLMEICQDGRRAARLSSPAEIVRELEIYEQAWESLAAEGLDPGENEARLTERMEALRAAPCEERGDDAVIDALRSLLPPGASLDQAVALLRAWDRVEAGEGEAEAPEFVEDALETFANYLGVRDAAWDPRGDAETLSLGEYEDFEGLPEGWERFVLTPLTRWNLEVV